MTKNYTEVNLENLDDMKMAAKEISFILIIPKEFRMCPECRSDNTAGNHLRRECIDCGTIWSPLDDDKKARFAALLSEEKEQEIARWKNTSTLDDFFGDGSADNVPECLYCGETDGDLIVSISDHYGPTHWHHQACKAQADEAKPVVVITPTWDEAMDECS